MKKFFSLMLLASTALLGLTCCGGGSGTDADTMTIKDFANGAKKFLIYNRIYLYIEPEGMIGQGQIGDNSDRVSCQCSFYAGETTVGSTYATYKKTDESMYELTYSFADSQTLSEEDVIMAFGFSPISQSGDDSFQVPTSIGSIGQLDNIVTYLDMASHQAHTIGEIAMVDPDTGQVLGEFNQIPAPARAFSVLPK